MDKTIKGSLAIAILLIGISASYYFVFALPAIQKQKLNAQLTAANWEQERQCSEAADKFFKASDHGDPDSGYGSHFNHKLNRCFILIKTISSTGTDIFEYSALMDVNGGAGPSLAVFDKKVPQGAFDYEVKPFVCKMLDKPCQTDDEFDAFVKQYMEQ